MSLKKIDEGVFCIAREITHGDMLFESIWELPTGVTVNSYLIKGEKNVLIDATMSDDDSQEAFIADLAQTGTALSDIDILILNHLEPDHSGFLPQVIKQNPSLRIYTTKKGVSFIKNFFKIENNLHEVTDGSTLPIDEKTGTLQFFETPNVHWPETMMCYFVEKKILFSCDCFGGFGATHGKLIDSEQSPESLKQYEYEMLRYYSNIMTSFNSFVLKAIEKVPQGVSVVCPSHGIIWKKNPQHIINLYKRYAAYGMEGNFEKEVCVIWSSMYGYTKKGVDAVICGLEKKGVPYTVIQIPNTAFTHALAFAYRAQALVLAMPTYEYKMFPPMAHLLDLFARKHFTKKTVLRIGCWGWIGGAKREYESCIEKMDWKNLPSYEWQGIPSNEDLKKLEALGEKLAESL